MQSVNCKAVANSKICGGASPSSCRNPLGLARGGSQLRDNHGDLIDVQNQRGVGYLNGRLCQFELIK